MMGGQTWPCVNRCGKRVRQVTEDDMAGLDIELAGLLWVHENGQAECGTVPVAEPGSDGTGPPLADRQWIFRQLAPGTDEMYAALRKAEEAGRDGDPPAPNGGGHRPGSGDANSAPPARPGRSPDRKP